MPEPIRKVALAYSGGLDTSVIGFFDYAASEHEDHAH
jgi:argininosuccinate synthase